MGGESGRTSTVSGNYWSSVTNSDNPTNAWNVNFNNGGVDAHNKTYTTYVQAVRGGKWPRGSAEGANSRDKLASPLLIFSQNRGDLFSLENIYAAYLKCRRRKRNTANALRFELNLEENLVDLEQRLKDRSYRPGRSILFAAIRPKLQEIFAADFIDRVAHHILVAELEKVWEPRFICDSYACRLGKGIHGAQARLREFIRRVSANKSLFPQPTDHGLPIGNLSSQFFANVYLDRLDQFVKRELKCRYYIRYADDFILLDRDGARLGELMGRSEEFALERLWLELHPRRGGPAPVSNGVDFLSFVVRHNYVLVRRRVVNNLKLRLEWYQKRLVSPQGPEYLCFRYDYDLLDELVNCLNSYLGHFQWANSYRLVRVLWKSCEFLGHYFDIELSTPALKQRYPLPRMYGSLPDQYERMLAHFPGCLLFFQVGSFYVMFNRQSLLAGEHFGLQVVKGKGWGTRKAGFPVVTWPKYRRLAMNRSLSFVQVRERANLMAAELRERLPAGVYLPWEAAA